MRLSIHFKLAGEKGKVPVDYRGAIISFLKKAFEKGNPEIYEILYLSKQEKPFTCSLWLGEVLQEGDFLIPGDALQLLFSTGDLSIFVSFYNGVMELKKSSEALFLGDMRFAISSVDVRPLKRIYSDEVLFKTVGISVLTDPRENARDFDKWFVTPVERERFEEALNLRLQDKFKRLQGRDIPEEVRVELPGENTVEEVIVKHYGGFLKGFKGYLVLKARPEVLQFLYDYGLGVRTGQGFGMIDVVSEDLQ